MGVDGKVCQNRINWACGSLVEYRLGNSVFEGRTEELFSQDPAMVQTIPLLVRGPAEVIDDIFGKVVLFGAIYPSTVQEVLEYGEVLWVCFLQLDLASLAFFPRFVERSFEEV